MSSATRFQGVEKGSTAYKLLAKMGWEEGKGLGAKGQGITQHVKVHKKADASGVGAAQAAAKARDWTVGMMAYDQVLAALKSVSSSPLRSQDDSGPSISMKPEALHEPPERNAAPVEGEKRKRKKGSKGAAQQAESAEVTPRPNKKQKRATAPAADRPQPAPREEDKGDAEEPQPKQPRLARHAGRFQKREKGKHVRGYSSTDLAAILGAGPSTDSLSDLPKQVQAEAEPVQPESFQVSNLSDPRGAVASSSGSDEPETGLLWWHGHFVPAGRGGSGYSAFASNKPKVEVKVNGFSEEDQANLWHMLTDDQSKAKQGLGQSSVLKKVAGARWEGTRKAIVDSDEDGDAEKAAPSAPAQGLDRPQSPPAGSHVVVPAKRCLAADQSQGGAEHDHAASQKQGNCAQSTARASDQTQNGAQLAQGGSQKKRKSSSASALSTTMSQDMPGEPGGAGEVGVGKAALAASARKLLKAKKLAREVLAGAAGQCLPLKAFKAELWEAAQRAGAQDRKAYVRGALAVLSGSKQFLVTKKSVSLAS